MARTPKVHRRLAGKIIVVANEILESAAFEQFRNNYHVHMVPILTNVESVIAQRLTELHHDVSHAHRGAVHYKHIFSFMATAWKIKQSIGTSIGPMTGHDDQPDWKDYIHVIDNDILDKLLELLNTSKGSYDNIEGIKQFFKNEMPEFILIPQTHFPYHRWHLLSSMFVHRLIWIRQSANLKDFKVDSSIRSFFHNPETDAERARLYL